VGQDGRFQRDHRLPLRQRIGHFGMYEQIRGHVTNGIMAGAVLTTVRERPLDCRRTPASRQSR
jgi:hypothetical protein